MKDFIMEHPYMVGFLVLVTILGVFDVCRMCIAKPR